MAIDCHAHWIPPLLAQALRRRRAAPRIVPTENGERFFTYQGNRPFDARLSDLEARRTFMRGCGVETQVVSLAGLFGVDCLPVEESVPLVRLFNDAVVEAQRESPDAFVGLAALPLAEIGLHVEPPKGAPVPMKYQKANTTDISIEVTDPPKPGERLQLVFHGLDTFATIWLNGEEADEYKQFLDEYSRFFVITAERVQLAEPHCLVAAASVRPAAAGPAPLFDCR